MDGLSFFNLASKRMSWLANTQRVVAENVANADTPGFKARTTEEFDKMLADGVQAPLKVSHPGHIRGAEASSVGVEEDPDAWSSSPNGNTVSLEQQSIKANEINENYQLAASLYRKGHELVRLAATGVR
ncbi:MAG: flagellar basal body protein [Pseudomonadota bacterium]